jgi:hypothetical protein
MTPGDDEFRELCHAFTEQFGSMRWSQLQNSLNDRAFFKFYNALPARYEMRNFVNEDAEIARAYLRAYALPIYRLLKCETIKEVSQMFASYKERTGERYILDPEFATRRLAFLDGLARINNNGERDAFVANVGNEMQRHLDRLRRQANLAIVFANDYGSSQF